MVSGATNLGRAALIYTPRERTTFKLLYGQSFRTPNLYELYYAALGSEPDPSLRPETVRTMELVWEQYFAHRFATTVSAFYYPIHDLIGERIDPANQNTFFANTGSLDLRGLDFELKRSLAAGLEATLSYSFQDASSSNPANQITNSPRHLVQASISAPIVKQKIFASMDLQYVSARATLGGQTAPAYVVPNFTIYSRNVLKHWEISASLYNAFNQKYFDPGGNGLTEDAILQDGRNFRIKVVYKLK